MANAVDKYLKVISDLLPNGKAWEHVKCSPLIKGMSYEFARFEERVRHFLGSELDPRLSVELLPDWEALLGIPDECTPENQTIERRQEQVVQKLTAQGGIDAAYYEFVGSQLGFAIEVLNTPDFRVGISRVGQELTNHEPLNSTLFRVGINRVGTQLRLYGWRFYFIVKVPASELEQFRVGAKRVGDRLVETGNELVECTIKKLKPAHVGVVFRFT